MINLTGKGRVQGENYHVYNCLNTLSRSDCNINKNKFKNIVKAATNSESVCSRCIFKTKVLCLAFHLKYTA